MVGLVIAVSCIWSSVYKALRRRSTVDPTEQSEIDCSKGRPRTAGSAPAFPAASIPIRTTATKALEKEMGSDGSGKSVEDAFKGTDACEPKK